MSNFLHRRKMTWALVLWSVYIATWTVITGAGPGMVVLWWLAGMIAGGSLWVATQPLFRQRGLSGFFVSPGWTDSRVVHLHRAHRARERRRDAG